MAANGSNVKEYESDLIDCEETQALKRKENTCCSLELLIQLEKLVVKMMMPAHPVKYTYIITATQR